jgi:hypothetical protein
VSCPCCTWPRRDIFVGICQMTTRFTGLLLQITTRFDRICGRDYFHARTLGRCAATAEEGGVVSLLHLPTRLSDYHTIYQITTVDYYTMR